MGDSSCASGMHTVASTGSCSVQGTESIRSRTSTSCECDKIGDICTGRKCSFGVASMCIVKSETCVSDILERMVMLSSRTIEVIWIDERTFEVDPKEWPACDVLWTLWTEDLPLDKIRSYVTWCKPLELNEVVGLLSLLDRRNMMRQCTKAGLPVPDYVVCSRDDDAGEDEPRIQESEDSLTVNGVRLSLPVLEKPADARDRVCFVYYPRSAGGGRARIGRQGFYDASHDTGRVRVRRSGSFIYQRFLQTQGFDMRLFIVGSSYVHGEAKRTLPSGHEEDRAGPVFLPVLLEPGEKELARRAALAFGQATFHLEVIRSQGSHGFAGQSCFVVDMKVEFGGMPRFEDSVLSDDIAFSLLSEIDLRLRRSKLVDSSLPHSSSSPDLSVLTASSPIVNRSLSDASAVTVTHRNSLPSTMEEDSTWRPKTRTRSSFMLDDCTTSPTDAKDILAALNDFPQPPRRGTIAVASPSRELVPAGDWSLAMTRIFSKSRLPPDGPQLCAVLAVLRHGDRTPKQKVKLKLKMRAGDIDPRFCLGALCGWILGCDVSADEVCAATASANDLRSTGQIQRLCSVLKSVASHCNQADQTPSFRFESLSAKDLGLLRAAIEILQKALLKPDIYNVHAKVEFDSSELKVALKWGGELTSVGEEQARNLGKYFRNQVYCEEDVTRMHATLRHDIRFHSSKEPRCAQTAASFAQGLLNLQSPLAAVQVTLVSEDGLGRLDPAPFKHSPIVEQVKKKAHELLSSGRVVDAAFLEELLPGLSRNDHVNAEFEKLRVSETSVLFHLQELAESVAQLDKELSKVIEHVHSNTQLLEMLTLTRHRWMDVLKEITGEPAFVKPGNVGRVLDYAKFDLRHTIPRGLHAVSSSSARDLLENFAGRLEQIYASSRSLASFSELVEYGTTDDEQLEIASTFLQPMLRKLRWDLRVASNADLGQEGHHLKRHKELYVSQAVGNISQPVRSRLYFAHNSHMQTLINFFRCIAKRKGLISESGEASLAEMPSLLGYLSHLILKLWKDDDYYTVSIEISTGDEHSTACDKDIPPPVLVVDHVPLQEVDDFLSELLLEDVVVSPTDDVGGEEGDE